MQSSPVRVSNICIALALDVCISRCKSLFVECQSDKTVCFTLNVLARQNQTCNCHPCANIRIDHCPERSTHFDPHRESPEAHYCSYPTGRGTQINIIQMKASHHQTSSEFYLQYMEIALT